LFRKVTHFTIIMILKMEWMSQVLLTVDIVNSGDLAEITIFNQPCVQNQVESIHLSPAWWLPHSPGRGSSGTWFQLRDVSAVSAGLALSCGMEAPAWPEPCQVIR
uniref:KH-like RNA-binding domain-containing protein n=1 Tax=Ursus maritimus TaxID=29073 RepID=A0A452U3G4_URSMA